MDRTKYQSWSQPLTHSISLKPDLGRSSNFLSVPGEGYFHLWNRYAEDFSNYNLNTWRVGEWTFESILGVGFAGLGRIDAKDRSNQPNLTFLVLYLYWRTNFYGSLTQKILFSHSKDTFGGSAIHKFVSVSVLPIHISCIGYSLEFYLPEDRFQAL